MTSSTPTPPAPGSNSAPTPASTPARLRGLDGLRGLAVIGVLIYHVFPGALPGGFIGVDLFFVISGFLITSLLVREREKNGYVKLRSFWGRRARRLLPALGTVLAICSSLALLVGGDVLYAIPRQILGAATFSYNWLDIAAGQSYFSTTAPELFRPMWSLAVEEQFYLLWPGLLLLLLLLRRRTQLLLVGIAALASASLMAVLFTPGADPTVPYFSTETHAFGLMIGAFLALAVHRAPLMRAPLRRLLGGAGLLCLVGLVYAAFTLEDTAAESYRGGLFAVSIMAAVVIWSASAPVSADGRALMGRSLDNRPLRWVGRRSYSLYLWHWPIYVLIGAWLPHLVGSDNLTGAWPFFAGVMTVVIATALSALSYRYLEEPIRSQGFGTFLRNLVATTRSDATRRWGLVAAALVVVLALTGTITAVASAPRLTSVEAAVEAGQQAIASQSASPRPHGSAPAPGQTVPSQTPPASPGTPSTSGTPGAPSGSSGFATPGTRRATPPPTLPGIWTPGSATMPSGSDISAIGDSVMLGAAPALMTRFPGISIDAEVSRQMSTAPTQVQNLARTGQLRPVLLLDLGTNGTISSDDLNQIANTLGSNRLLVLLNIYAARTWTPGDNQVLSDFAQAHLRNTVLVNWAEAIGQNTGMLYSDQIHPNPAAGGTTLYANTIYTALQQRFPLPAQ